MVNSEPTQQHKSSSAHRLRAVLQILQVRLRFIVLMALVGIVAGNWEDIMNHLDRIIQTVRMS